MYIIQYFLSLLSPLSLIAPFSRSILLFYFIIFFKKPHVYYYYEIIPYIIKRTEENTETGGEQKLEGTIIFEYIYSSLTNL